MQTCQTTFKRHEKKYILSASQAQAFLNSTCGHLKPDEYGRYTISSLYFDTAGYRALSGAGGSRFKQKLRLRSYGVPAGKDTVFLELKNKLDGIGYKRRVPLPLHEAKTFLQGGEVPKNGCQIFKEIGWFCKQYPQHPVLVLGYDRRAFCGVQDSTLRITLDTNIRWRANALDLASGLSGTPLLPKDTVLMEIKVAGSMPLWLAHALGAVHAKPVSFSKYRTAALQNLQKMEAISHAG